MVLNLGTNPKFSTYSEAEILLNTGQEMQILNTKVINGELHLEVEILNKGGRKWIIKIDNYLWKNVGK